MFNYLLLKTLSRYHREQSSLKQGFTLIELLVVIIIIGILTAIGLPNLVNQTSKARQTEAKTLLGSMNRAQQTYRYENGSFTNDLSLLDVTFTEEYYNYSVDQVNGSASVTHQAIAGATYNQDLKDYASGVYYFANTTRLSTIVCEANSVTGTASASIDINVADCDSNSTQIR